MSIQQVLDAMEPTQRFELESGTPPRSDARQLFVAPLPDQLPDDGVLEYVPIVSVYDVKTAPDRSVLLIDEKELEVLRVLTAHQAVFGIELRYLVGLPAANYSVAFDQATWNLDRVAYAPLVSEINLSVEMEKQRAAAGRTQHDIEREQYTRADGTVKEHTRFSVATVEGGDDYADEDES